MDSREWGTWFREYGYIVLEVLRCRVQLHSFSLPTTCFPAKHGFVVTVRVGTCTLLVVGVPFAHPPKGPLRFRKPLPEVMPKSGIRDALMSTSQCPQIPRYGNKKGRADCLYRLQWSQLPSSLIATPYLILIPSTLFTSDGCPMCLVSLLPSMASSAGCCYTSHYCMLDMVGNAQCTTLLIFLIAVITCITGVIRPAFPFCSCLSLKSCC